tara:strand:- start:3108 stop:5246 length:2139 start_codon:yes stop_codon:yes gene_type:complete
MKKIKVLLADPRHKTVGMHSAYVPIAIGYIGAYLIKMIESKNSNVKIETKLEVDPDVIFDLIDDWKPNIVASGNYVWASDLAYRICEYAKEKNEDTLCVLGGPEFPTGSETIKPSDAIKNKCFEYLQERPCIDYYTYGDGEPALVNVVQKYIDNSFSSKLMREKNVIAAGAMNLELNGEQILVGKDIPRLGLHNKVDGMDSIPSPYLSGLLDKYLNGEYVPSFQTARGCPFLCTFCEMGLDQNKIVSFSTNRMKKELDYVCEKVSKFSKNRAIFIYDSNWGMYQKDLVLSDHFLKLINKSDWPSSIIIATPKNKKQQILDIDKKLKNRVVITLSQQSMNIETLKLIKRDNMSNDQYIKFVKELDRRGKNPICELIIPMPKETKQTYLDNIRFLLDYGVNPSTVTLLLLRGTELGRDDAIKKWGMKTKYRVVPRDFGTYRNKKIFDIERVCVETNTMSYQDYLECRKFSLIIQFFSYPMFFLFKKFCKELNVSSFEYIWSVFQKLQKKSKDVPSELLRIYNEFAKESEDELFESKEAIYDFYSKEENYKKLLSGDLGANLLSKYSAKLLSCALQESFDFSISIMSEMFGSVYNQDESRKIAESSRLWLKNLYIFDAIFDWEKEKNRTNIINLEYDIPQWFKDEGKSILDYKKRVNYKIAFNKQNETLKNDLISSYSGKGKNLSIIENKIFTLGQYLHVRKNTVDEIEKSVIKI